MKIRSFFNRFKKEKVSLAVEEAGRRGYKAVQLLLFDDGVAVYEGGEWVEIKSFLKGRSK